MALVTLYTKSDCQPCKLTAKKLGQFGIEFDSVPLDVNPEAREVVGMLGYTSAPVVVVELDSVTSWSWAGYRPGEIERLKKYVVDGVDPEVVAA